MKMWLVMLAFAAGAPAALAGSISIPTSGGGNVFQYGSFPFALNTAAVAPGTNLTHWTTQGGFIYRTWMEFDLSAVPAGATVDSVSFRFFQNLTNAFASTTMVIRGGYEAGEMAHDELFGYAGSKGLIGQGLFNSTTNDGTVFGGLAMSTPNQGTYQSAWLTNPGSPGGVAGLAYFNAQIGNRIMLVGGRNSEAPFSFGHDGSLLLPTLEITYTDAPVVPLPHASGMAMAGLGVLAMRRRRG